MLVGKYIPNLVSKPFDVSHECTQHIYDQTSSLQLDERSLGRCNTTPYIILMELLAYQLASPVRWIASHNGVDPSKIDDIRIYLHIESAIRRMIGISDQKYLGDLTNPSADSRMPKGQCNDRLVYSNIRDFTSLTQSCHAPRRSRTLPPLDYTMDYDACDALLHHVFKQVCPTLLLFIYHPHLRLQYSHTPRPKATHGSA